MIYEIKNNETCEIIHRFKTSDFYDYVCVDNYSIEVNRTPVFYLNPLDLDYMGKKYKFVSMGIFGAVTCIYLDEM